MARRRHSNRRRRRGNFGFLYKLLSVLVICAAVVMALTLFFRVDTIEVTGTERYTEKDVIEASGIQLGDNLFLLNKYEAARSIAEQLPYIDIEDIRIRRELPDTLLIDVAECGTPLAVIQDGSAWLLSPKGKIVEQLPASQAGDYAVIDGCELLAPSVGTDIALSTEFANQQTSLLALLAAALLPKARGAALLETQLSFDALFEADYYFAPETAFETGLLRLCDLPDLAKLAGRVCAFTPKTPAGGSLAPHTPTPIPARWEKDALSAAAEWLEDKLC